MSSSLRLSLSLLFTCSTAPHPAIHPSSHPPIRLAAAGANISMIVSAALRRKEADLMRVAHITARSCVYLITRLVCLSPSLPAGNKLTRSLSRPCWAPRCHFDTALSWKYGVCNYLLVRSCFFRAEGVEERTVPCVSRRRSASSIFKWVSDVLLILGSSTL